MPRWPEREPERRRTPAARVTDEAVQRAEADIRASRVAAEERKAMRRHVREARREKRRRWQERGDPQATLRDPDTRGRGSRRDRQRDPSEPRIAFAERKRHALEDLAVYRSVSLRDLSDARFGGNDFAARRAVSQLQAAKLVVPGIGWGPKGKPFRILATTPAGAREAARRGPEGQRRWDGLVKPAEAHHDTAVYRAGRERAAALEREGHRITRIRIDAELKSELARASERARAIGGSRAAKQAQHAKARELGLPVEGGKVHIPDVQLEYEPVEGPPGLEPGRANIEVVTASYKEGSIRAKAALGFHLAASGPAAARRMLAALTAGSSSGGGRRIDLGETEGRGGGGGELEEFEF